MSQTMSARTIRPSETDIDRRSRDVLVLYSFKNHKGGFNKMVFDKLRAHAAEQSYPLNLFRGSLSDMHVTVKDNVLTITESLTGRSIDSFDVIYFEYWYRGAEVALAVARYAHRRGIPFFCEELAYLDAQTKVGELAIMSDSGVPLPNSFISSNAEIKKVFRKQPPLQFPLIVKAADSFGGNNNFLVRDYDSLVAVLDTAPGIRFVVQEFIPNNCDYRCLVFGGKISLVLKRSRGADAKTHLNNTSQGAVGETVPVNTLSDAVQADVIRAARLLHRNDFAGVDLMIDSETGQHYILEVNQQPQIETGAAVDQKMNALLDYMQACADGERPHGQV